MYNKVLVPLDGSDLAEEALPHLQEIAAGCSIPEILLISVTEPVAGRVSMLAAPTQLLAVEGHVPPRTGPLALGSTHTGLLYSG